MVILERYNNWPNKSFPYSNLNVAEAASKPQVAEVAEVMMELVYNWDTKSKIINTYGSKLADDHTLKNIEVGTMVFIAPS